MQCRFLRFFNPNRTLVSVQISFACWADVLSMRDERQIYHLLSCCCFLHTRFLPSPFFLPPLDFLWVHLPCLLFISSIFCFDFLLPSLLIPHIPSYPSLLHSLFPFSTRLSRARVDARAFQQAVCVFCCHKCHTKSVCPFIYPSFFHSFPWFLRRKKGENIRCCSLFVKTYLQSRRNRFGI